LLKFLFSVWCCFYFYYFGVENLQVVINLTRGNSRAIAAIAAPKAVSSKTERAAHQDEMKNNAIVLYNCTHATNTDITKCMVLGSYFSTNLVVGGHLISAEQKSSMELLGLPAAQVWNARNCILWHNAFEKKFSSQELVS
jgi:hypothetical protein